MFATERCYLSKKSQDKRLTSNRGRAAITCRQGCPPGGPLRGAASVFKRHGIVVGSVKKGDKNWIHKELFFSVFKRYGALSYLSISISCAQNSERRASVIRGGRLLRRKSGCHVSLI